MAFTRGFQSRNRESYLFKMSMILACARRTMFQSRNRESYLFKINKSNRKIRYHYVSISESRILSFQAKIRNTARNQIIPVSISESRILSFQGNPRRRTNFTDYMFQSRNRESYLFKPDDLDGNFVFVFCFNLGIENLIFSRVERSGSPYVALQVSISESRILSFKICFSIAIVISSLVSISESRILSFQEPCNFLRKHRIFRFNLGIENLIFSSRQSSYRLSLTSPVSISESRILSFQVADGRGCDPSSKDVSISESRILSFQGRTS